MYQLLGICLALAGLLIFNAFASLLAALLWRALEARAQFWPARVRAQLLFTLRVFPVVAAGVCVLALLLPAYIVYEPRHEAEAVSVKLGALAAISAAGLLLAVWRGLAAWLVTRRLINDWLVNSEQVHLAGVPVPAYRVRHSFPVIAVVGALQPKLFIADHLFDRLRPDELSATIAHECGHLAARDSLKRTLVRACRDALSIVPCGRILDRAWAEAAEAAADEHAACAGGLVALDLAAALVKIARLAPPGVRPAIPAGASLIGENVSGIKQRVQRLTQLAVADSLPEESGLKAVSASLRLSFGALLIVALAPVVNPPWLAFVHHLIEATVSILQ